MRYCFLLLLLLSACSNLYLSEDKEKKEAQLPINFQWKDRQLTDEDLAHIQKLAENAFFEVRSEGIDDIHEQVYSVLNRARRWTRDTPTATINKPFAYSWKIELTKAQIKNHKKYNKKLYDEIYEVAKEVYINYKDGSEDYFKNMKISRNHDHYITIKLAKTNPPYWFKKYCIDKRVVGSQIYCIGIPKIV